MAERHDNIIKLRNENREIEEKLREALASASHRGEVIKQLRDEIKQYQGRVSQSALAWELRKREGFMIGIKV